MRFRLWIPSVHRTECLTKQFLNNFLPNTREYQAIVTTEPFTANRREKLAVIARLPLFWRVLLLLVMTSWNLTGTQPIGSCLNTRPHWLKISTQISQLDDQTLQQAITVLTARSSLLRKTVSESVLEEGNGTNFTRRAWKQTLSATRLSAS